MKPRPQAISVIVPVRDGDRYLGAALESIVRQTLAADEILVIDDGSQDTSPQIAREFSPLVRCISTPPQGPAAARNLGISLARGDFLAFLDADDRWSRTKLADQHAILAAEPALEAVFGLVQCFLSPDLTPEEARRLVCPAAAQSGWLIGSMMIRREGVARVGQLDEKLRVGDFVDWAHRARGLKLQARNVPKVVLHRRIHTRNLSRLGQGDRGDFLDVALAALKRHRAATVSPADGPDPDR